MSLPHLIQNKGHLGGHVLLGMVVLAWGANFGIIKSAYDHIPPLLFAAIRFTIMGSLLLVLTYWKEKNVRIEKKDLGKIIMVGAMGLGFFQILWSIGLNLTSSSNSALIFATQPLLGAIYLDIVKKEPVGKHQYLGMLLALIGVVFVILKPTAKLHFSLATFPGDLLTLIAGFCGAIFATVGSKPLLNKYSPLKMTSYWALTASLVLWIASFFSGQSVMWNELSGNSWWSLGYAVVLSGMIAHVFWFEGIDRIGVTQSMVYLYLVPVCAVLFNYFMMKEKIFLQQIFGGTLILFGVYLALKTASSVSRTLQTK